MGSRTVERRYPSGKKTNRAALLTDGKSPVQTNRTNGSPNSLCETLHSYFPEPSVRFVFTVGDDSSCTGTENVCTDDDGSKRARRTIVLTVESREEASILQWLRFALKRGLRDYAVRCRAVSMTALDPEAPR